MAVIDQMKSAFQEAVALINDIGTPVVYTPKSTGIPVTVNAMIRELGNAELVGDFRQGDLRIEIDATKLAAEPEKYDEVVIGLKRYRLSYGGGSPRRVGDTVYTYKFIIRGD